ncbi:MULTISPECIES: M23 family metallopeptidase [unclassified Knoellia]|uniref:M23 family metallopeptidase n=1 Tax=Knoellia altitudinis TaxID=3404795 RepID=UPI00360B3F84
MLPTAAAVALVVTATGATVAESAPLTLDLTAAQAQTARDQAATEVAQQADLSTRRQQVAIQTAALQGRVTEQKRVARDKARVAAAVRAKAAAEAAAEAAEAAAEAAAQAKMQREGKRWVMPIEGASFTSGYGMRWGRMHWGNDFGTAIGTPLRAMSRGTVTFTGNNGNMGKLVRITYWDGTESFYAHMSRYSSAPGDEVMPGEIVGYTGNTGRSTGPHLHLEIHPEGAGAVNPAPWLAEKGLQ